MRNLFGILKENLSNSVGLVRVRSNKPTHARFSRGFKSSSAAHRFPGSLLLDGDFRAAQKETGVKDADIADGSDVNALNIKREEKGKVCRLLNSASRWDASTSQGYPSTVNNEDQESLAGV